MSGTQGRLSDHVDDHAVPSPEGSVLVTTPGMEFSYPRLSQSLNDSPMVYKSVAMGMASLSALEWFVAIHIMFLLQPPNHPSEVREVASVRSPAPRDYIDSIR